MESAQNIIIFTTNKSDLPIMEQKMHLAHIKQEKTTYKSEERKVLYHLEAPHSMLIVSKRFSANRFASSKLLGLVLDKNKCNGFWTTQPNQEI